jgi:hypothetical protein
MDCLMEPYTERLRKEKRTKPTGRDVCGDEDGRTAGLELAKHPVTFTSAYSQSGHKEWITDGVHTVLCLHGLQVRASRLGADTS